MEDGNFFYRFNAFSTSGNAIAVLLKDAKEVHCFGSSYTAKDPNDLTDGLENNEITWLLDQAKGFRVFRIGQSLLLFMKENECIVKCPGFHVEGCPGEDGLNADYNATMTVEKATQGDDFNVLSELARKLTPQGKKLSFAPGRYCFGSTFFLDVVELTGLLESAAFLCYSKMRRDDSVRSFPNATPGAIDEYIKQMFQNSTSDQIALWEETAERLEKRSQMMVPRHSDAPIPLDFDIIVGEGDGRTTIKANKAVLATFLPKFESLLEDINSAKTLVLPDLDHDAVETVLDAFTSRKPYSMPYACSIYGFSDEAKAVKKVGDLFGVDPYGNKKAKIDDSNHPAFNNPRWSDVTFIVGPTNEEIKANRAVLASLNPVLYRILYGTGSISVDPSQPIRWPDFDALAVKKVLLAMVQLGKKEVVVPSDVVPSAEAFVDYLIETPRKLNLYYETPFAREFENGASFTIGEDGEGLALA